MIRNTHYINGIFGAQEVYRGFLPMIRRLLRKTHKLIFIVMNDKFMCKEVIISIFLAMSRREMT
jgi:hypothetical protein